MDDAPLTMRKAPAGERLNAAPVEPARAPAVPHQGDTVSVHNVEQEPLDAVMDQALTEGHWERALRAEEANDGAPGPDGMRPNELRAHLDRYRAGIRRKLLDASRTPVWPGSASGSKPKPATMPWT